MIEDAIEDTTVDVLNNHARIMPEHLRVVPDRPHSADPRARRCKIEKIGLSTLLS